MDSELIKINIAYKKAMLEEDVAPAAPSDAMSSGPLLAQFHTDPKLSVYYPATGKRKYFKRKLELESYLKENPDWKSLNEDDDFSNLENQDNIKIDEKKKKKYKYTITGWGNYVPGLNDVDYSDHDSDGDNNSGDSDGGGDGGE
jgi:hypothetical protein